VAAFWKGRDGPEALDGDLRARRAEAPREFVDRLDDRIRGMPHRSRTGRIRFGIGIAISGLALAAIGSAGAVSSASSSAQHFAVIVEKAVGQSHDGASKVPAPNGKPDHGNPPRTEAQPTADGPGRAGTPDAQPAPTPTEAQPAQEPVDGNHHNPAHHQYLITICHLTDEGIYVERTIPIDQLHDIAGPHDIIPAPPEGCPKPHHH
jgi:hypothetical protein